MPGKEIWEKQVLPKDFIQPLKTILVAAYNVIVHPPGGRNITEWCKREECWSAVLALDIKLKLPDVDDRDGAGEADSSKPLTAQELAIVEVVKHIHPDVWVALAKWAKSTQSLSAIQRKIAEALGKQASTGKLNRRLAREGGLLLVRATHLGWTHPKLPRDAIRQIQKSAPRN